MRKIQQILVVLLLVFMCLSECTHFVCAAPLTNQAGPKHISLMRESYHGWNNAYHLTNGIVDLVIVPQIGRVMAYYFTGHLETSPFWNNPLWAGKPLSADPATWANYGGDKLWPSEQSQWPTHQPRGWPPDQFLDDGPYTAMPIKNGLRLISPISPYYAGRFIREITLTPGSSSVILHETFLKAMNATGDKDGFPIGIWSISQVHGDARVFVPINRKGLFAPLGYYTMSDKQEPQSNWIAEGNLLEVTRNTLTSTKMGADDTSGWMATLYGGNLLFSHHFTRLSNGVYPDKNTNAQVYTNASTTEQYIEVESLGPMTNLRAGQNISRTVVWNLERLPRIPRDDMDARALVSDAMKKSRRTLP